MGWQEVNNDTHRMSVPGGWLYRTTVSAYGKLQVNTVFVPTPQPEYDPAKVSPVIDQLTKNNSELRSLLREIMKDFERQLQDHPMDPSVMAIVSCGETKGYGALMSEASRQWREKSPHGAFVPGPCVGTVKHYIKRIKELL